MFEHIEAFHRPRSLAEAVRLLQDPVRTAIPVAGATEVGLRVRRGVKALVDLSGLGLDRLWTDEVGLHIGAMVRAARLAGDETVRAEAGDAVAEAAFAMASSTVRNLATIGGNVIHLTSWSDTPPALQALDARFRVQGPSDRWYDCGEFLGDLPGRLLGKADILTEILVPRLPAATGTAFIKYSKTAVDFALVNGAAFVTLEGDVVTAIRLSVGAIHTPPIRLAAAEATLAAKTVTAEGLAELQRAAAAEVSPRGDARASEAYLRTAAGVVVRRCVERAIERARAKGGQGA